MIPYLTIPFSLSEKTLSWLKEHTDPIVEDYQKNAPLDSGLVELDKIGGDELFRKFHESDAFKEILELLEPVGLNEQPIIQLFIYKWREKPIPGPAMGNPHLDTYNGVDGIVPIRFNILLNGQENQEMVWWDIHDMYNDPRLHIIKFPRPAEPGKFSVRCQVKGESKEERWATAGRPTWSNNRLTKINTFASFVKTDQIHAINWTGKEPRLIMSLRYLSSWDKIEEFRNRVPELYPQLPALLDQSS